jgi:hypothetical protein
MAAHAGHDRAERPAAGLLRMTIAKGFAGPIEEWSHDDLLNYMGWEIVEGLMSGKPLRSVLYQMPMMVINWSDAQRAQRAQPTKKVKK